MGRKQGIFVRRAAHLTLVLSCAALLWVPRADGALMACGARDKATGRLRDGATIRVRSACKSGEVLVDLARLTNEPVTNCGSDAVRSGDRCVDKYEASGWDIPPAATDVIEKVKNGTVTLSDLVGAGAVQVGVITPPFLLAPLPDLPAPIYAVSIPGVLPTTNVSAFRAHDACRLSGKRLLLPSEWRDAMAGTPDPDSDDGTSDCNVGDGTWSGGPSRTGSRSSCVSTAGVHDGIGNVDEITYDPDAPFGGYRVDMLGGNWTSGAWAGVDAVWYNEPFGDGDQFGFRCVR